MLSRPLCNVYTILALQCASAVVGQSLSLRGAMNIFARNMPLESTANATSVLCRITMFDTLILSKENVSSTREQTTCLPIVNEVETDLDFSIDLPEDLVKANIADIEMGKLLVKVIGAEMVDDKLVIGQRPQFEVVHDHRLRHLQERHLQSTGVMTLAVIRISTSDAAPTASAATLKNALFGGLINFATQYDSCSFGKLKWKMAGSGVIDVRLPNKVSAYASSAELVTAAQKQLKAQNGGKEVSSMGNKVFMCLPPGTGDWAASAGINHWRAQFNNDWCTSLSGIVHELGHTMGLLHAAADGVEYADRSGYMGSGYTNGKWPRKCFNGFNSWRFGWYSTRHLSHNPLTDGDRLVKLATFVDFKKTAMDEVVLINIANQYYLEYNRAKGFNIHTEHAVNQVSVTQPNSHGTNRLAGLSAGAQYEVPNFNGSSQTLIIAACQTLTGSLGSEIMVLSLAMGQSLCGTNATKI
jgi:Gametolysin peptidase M11